MSNVHGLFSNKDNDSSSDDDENNRFVGGISSRGGGSGLAVQPNLDDVQGSNARDQILGQATNATSDDHEEVRRTITMYRDGFTVDDGPYRRLDDPNNADFLRSLAMGRTPRELIEETGDQDVVVGLVDKRQEEYVEQFRSFSGQGNSLGTTRAADASTDFDPAALGDAPEVDASSPATSIQVKLPDGKRKVLKINTSSTVSQLAAAVAPHIVQQPFRLVAGFPPKAIPGNETIDEAGLKGASINVQLV